MPHVIVKLWPGKSEQQKKNLAEAITKDVMEILHYSHHAFGFLRGMAECFLGPAGRQGCLRETWTLEAGYQSVFTQQKGI
jgi:hypothetical protein